MWLFVIDRFMTECRVHPGGIWYVARSSPCQRTRAQIAVGQIDDFRSCTVPTWVPSGPMTAGCSP